MSADPFPLMAITVRNDLHQNVGSIDEKREKNDMTIELSFRVTTSLASSHRFAPYPECDTRWEKATGSTLWSSSQKRVSESLRPPLGPASQEWKRARARIVLVDLIRFCGPAELTRCGTGRSAHLCVWLGEKEAFPGSEYHYAGVGPRAGVCRFPVVISSVSYS